MRHRLARRPIRLARALLLSLLVGWLSACTGLPKVDRHARATEAIELSTQTTLGRIAGAYRPDPLHSGFRLMPLGSYALDTRVELARRAEESLDVQYYHFEHDETGRWLLRALRDAALRGVRVRLLVDDWYTTGQDELLLAFAAHANVEVRIFNPFVVRRDGGHATRFVSAVGDWKRVNHRMHNKLFIADGAMAVFGGRNIANEYFLRGVAENFIDVDAFAVGFVVPPFQALFDRYWNSPAVYPLQTIVVSQADPQEQRRRFEELTGPATDAPTPAIAAQRPAGLRPAARGPGGRSPGSGLGLCLRVRRSSRQTIRGRGRRRTDGDQRHLQRLRGAAARRRPNWSSPRPTLCPGRTA